MSTGKSNKDKIKTGEEGGKEREGQERKETRTVDTSGYEDWRGRTEGETRRKQVRDRNEEVREKRMK